MHGEVSRGVLSSANDDDGGGFTSAMREQLQNQPSALIITVTHVRNGRQVSARATSSASLSS